MLDKMSLMRYNYTYTRYCLYCYVKLVFINLPVYLNLMAQSIKPLFDYILVKPVKQEQATASGIILPENVKEKPQIGEVMAVGTGWHNNDGKVFPLEIKKGQKVIYKKWGGNEIKVENEEWMLIKQEDIMAVVA